MVSISVLYMIFFSEYPADYDAKVDLGHSLVQDGCEPEHHELKLSNSSNSLCSHRNGLMHMSRNIYGIDKTTRTIYDLSHFRPIRAPRVVPPTLWTPSCQPHVEHGSLKVSKWFLDNWPFPHGRAKQKVCRCWLLLGHLSVLSARKGRPNSLCLSSAHQPLSSRR